MNLIEYLKKKLQRIKNIGEMENCNYVLFKKEDKTDINNTKIIICQLDVKIA